MEALQKAENAVWDQAKQEKQEAVLKARNEEKSRAEKLLQRKIKEYEQLIKVKKHFYLIEKIQQALD